MGHKKCGILIDFDDVVTKFATMSMLSTTTSTCVHHIFCRCLEFFSGFWDQETVRIGGGTGVGRGGLPGRRGQLGPEGKEEESVKEAKS